MLVLATTLVTTLAAGAAAGGDKGIESLLSFQALTAFVILAALEIVLGIDNIVFIAILAEKLPAEQQEKARKLGLTLAMGIRIVLLLAIGWVMGLTNTLFNVPLGWLGQNDIAISGRDLILIVVGLFLIYKATHEIHDKLEGEEHDATSDKSKPLSFGSVITQILLLDIVFSLDSVITAVGMVEQVWVMIVAVVIAVGFMIFFAEPISSFVERHPTVKMLALSFLLLIGVALIAEGLDQHIPKGYIYFAMAFTVFVEMLNLRLRKGAKPVRLREPYVPEHGLPGEQLPV